MLLSHTRLRELFDYLPSGNLIRKITSTNSHAGNAIGWDVGGGYLNAMVDGVTYKLHELIWLWHGRQTAPEIDHINRNPSDNRIENLREATRSQNMYNRRKPKTNTSGAKNVVWKKDKQMWCVRVGIEKKRLHIGYFKDFELAELVAAEARDKYHGSFANHF